MKDSELKIKIVSKFWELLNIEHQIEFTKYTASAFYKYLHAEAVFQFFVTRILTQNNLDYICLQNESNKTPFERTLNAFMGNKKAISDLFVVLKDSKGAFLELKKETPYKKTGELKKNKHLERQNEFLKEMRKNGYNASFCYPDNFLGILNSLIKLI